MLARQTVNVNQREKDLNIFYFTFLHNLHVNQAVKLTLQPSEVFCCSLFGILWIVPVLARLTWKIERRENHLCHRTLNFAKKLFKKISLDNLCKRPLISFKKRCDSLTSSIIFFLCISFLRITVRSLFYCWTPKIYFWRKGQILSRSDVNLIIVIKSNWISC